MLRLSLLLSSQPCLLARWPSWLGGRSAGDWWAAAGGQLVRTCFVTILLCLQCADCSYRCDLPSHRRAPSAAQLLLLMKKLRETPTRRAGRLILADSSCSDFFFLVLLRTNKCLIDFHLILFVLCPWVGGDLSVSLGTPFRSASQPGSVNCAADGGSTRMSLRSYTR